MADPTIKTQAPTPADEIAVIEKAVGAETESTKQTEVEDVSAFDVLAEKKGFKSVEDLVSAYTNLESTMNPTRKELKELKTMVKSIQDQSKPEAEDPYGDLSEEQKQVMSLIDSAFDRRLKKELSPLLKKLEVEEASSQIQGIRKQYPDVSDGELEQSISLMEKYPSMELDEAVKIASYDRAVSSAKKRTEKTEKKKTTFSESAATAKAGDDTDYSKMTLEELESLLEIPAHAR